MTWVISTLGTAFDDDDATAFEITRPSLALLWLARFVAALCTFADRPNGAWKMDNGKRDDFVTGLLASGPMATCLRPQTDRRSGREESHCATELPQHTQCSRKLLHLCQIRFESLESFLSVWYCSDVDREKSTQPRSAIPSPGLN